MRENIYNIIYVLKSQRLGELRKVEADVNIIKTQDIV